MCRSLEAHDLDGITINDFDTGSVNDLNGEAFRVQVALDRCGDLLVVLDEANLDASIVPLQAESRLKAVNTSQAGVSTPL